MSDTSDMTDLTNLRNRVTYTIKSYNYKHMNKLYMCIYVINIRSPSTKTTLLISI